MMVMRKQSISPLINVAFALALLPLVLVDLVRSRKPRSARPAP